MGEPRGNGTKAQREQLRWRMQTQGCTPEQIAEEMARRWGFRRRAAWRHAYGWTQDEVAARYNQVTGDPSAPMTAKRISDYEAWPLGGIKPTLTALSMLAQVFSTQVVRLVDFTDREAMTKPECIALGAVDAFHDAAAPVQLGASDRDSQSQIVLPSRLTKHASDLIVDDTAVTSDTDSSADESRGGITEAVGMSMDGMRRTEFLAGLVGIATVPILGWREKDRLSPMDVHRFRRSLTNLYALDDQYGGSGEVYTLTVRLLHQVRRRLEQATYSPEIGSALRSIAGEVTEHAGWLAYDAGHHHEARYWWLEALHMARLSNADTAEVVVLASMSRQASKKGRGREAVELAQAARRVTRAPTPRLMSILAAREALGYARAGEARNATRALGEARDLLAGGLHDDDPSWLEFWDEADLALHETVAMCDLEDLPAAETSARNALDHVNVIAYPRNHALYLAQLGRVLTARNELDEAVSITVRAVNHAAELNSARVITDVRMVLDNMRPHANARPVRELLEWSAAVLPTS